MKSAASDYEIVLEKLEMMESWKEEKDEDGVKESLVDWMLTNKEGDGGGRRGHLGWP